VRDAYDAIRHAPGQLCGDGIEQRIGLRTAAAVIDEQDRAIPSLG
jgi:hypothetical protein